MNTQNILSDSRSKTLRRSTSFDGRTIDKEARTVELSFASEAPVERYFGLEVLGCSKAEVDLSRANDGAPLLRNHNPECHIGTVENARVDADGVCRAVVRFSRGEEGEEAFQDVQDGILRKVSVGYCIKEMELTGEADEMKTYRVTKWEPYEVSLVSIPADNSVGVGRSADASAGAQAIAQVQTETQSSIENTNTMSTENTAPAVSVKELENVRSQEVSRVREINAIANKFKVEGERTMKALNDGESVDSFRQFVLENIVKATPVTVSPEIGMSTKEREGFSIMKAVREIASGKGLTGLEREASEACNKIYQREAGGFWVPHDVAIHRRAMNASGFSAGGATVQTDVLGGSLIELLRNRTQCAAAGATQLGGLVGNVAIPRQTGAAQAYWSSETGSTSASQQTVQQLGLTPKRLAARTAYTKQFLAQSSIDVESFVREDLMKILAIAKDRAALFGLGGAQPLGIANTTGISTTTYSGAATFAKIVDSETQVATANADIGPMKWIINPATRGKWKTTSKTAAGYPLFLIEDNMANGYDVLVTNQIPTSAGSGAPAASQSFFGVWSELIMADWAGFDIVVDPYTLAADNQIAITTTIFTDIGIRHPAAFCVSTDSAAQ